MGCGKHPQELGKASNFRFGMRTDFFNRPLVAAPDVKHSQVEDRYYVLGHTNARRFLFVVFSIRKDLIRAITARDMIRKEKRKYEAR